MSKLRGEVLTLPKMSGSVSTPKSLSGSVGAKTINIGGKGDDGATFIPSVSADGIISWTNDKDLPNPEPVNIKGTKGDKGDKGDRGLQGVQGIQGERGEQGQKGDKGDRGEQGIQGIQGAKGETGAQGQKGADGTPATHRWSGTTLYITSASGTSSANLKGEKGDKGDKGDTGATGAQGEPGKDGADGKDGKSATHSWNGTVLTITSASGTSSADLKGDPGEPGVDGADYILTDADKTEIAEMAAELVEIPDSSQNVNHTEPAVEDIPKVFFGGALQQTKVEVVVPFRYVSKTEDISGYAKIKAQGNSTMSYPKKNQTVKLFKDVGCTENMKMNFKGWGKQSKFVFKANWVDLSQARNVVSSRLWADVVKSRADYETLPEQLRKSPNMGAIDGFLVKVYADGVYQGRYTLNIPKDKWMTNMDDSLENHCVLCSEGDTAGSSRFKAEALVDGTDWTDEIHDAVPESIKNRWNEVINFVLNSTDEEFKANLGNYFDVQSLIDYYLFGIVSCNYDGFNKNQLYLTYDGMKWFASVYDLDLTWGISDDGPSLIDYDTMWYMEYDWNKLYCRIDSLFIQELCERWKELRTTVFDVGNIINHFERFTDICPPWLVEEDYAETTADGAFTAMPTLSTIQQIRDYAQKRHAWTNAYLGGHDVGGLMLYELPKETTLDGTYGIDTGVNLNALDAYTVLIDYTLNSNEALACILENALNQRGWWMQYAPNLKFGAFGAGTNAVFEAVHPWATSDPTGIRVKVMVRKTADGVYTFRSSDMESPNFRNFTSLMSEGVPEQNLWIGGNYYAEGVVNAFANATIHDCKVYDIALTDTVVLEYLQS